MCACYRLIKVKKVAIFQTHYVKSVGEADGI